MSFKFTMVSQEQALPGRSEKNQVGTTHAALGNTTVEPFPPNLETAMFGLGCFWGSEKMLWQLKGVFSTQVGFCGGFTPNPTDEEVGSGQTGHAEVVRVQYDSSIISYADLLEAFWNSHDPTQGFRQHSEEGTSYRSSIYTYGQEQQKKAEKSRDIFQKELTAKGFSNVTTEIKPVGEFYYAEDSHQQYLEKNKDGYCGLKGLGVTCPLTMKEELQRV